MKHNYKYKIRKLSADEGGGYLIEYPDLPGCRSDGETEAEAIKNGEDAVQCWLEARESVGRIQNFPKNSH